MYVPQKHLLITQLKKLKIVVAKGDITVSVHYWREEDINCLQNMIHKKGPDVMLPHSSQINAHPTRRQATTTIFIIKRGFNCSGTTILKELITNINRQIM